MSSAVPTLARLRPRGIRLGLETIRPLLTRLGNPQDRYATVLVAGTNGKGSTAALLAAMAAAAGYRVGLFTSPPLAREQQEIRLAGRCLGAAELERLVAEIAALTERCGLTSLTAFEAWTAAAFCHFARGEAELAVVEVGMGGARDSTNAADPVVSVVTTVSDDHGAFLGPTLQAIATEKAGVCRAGRPAVVGWIESAAAAAVDESIRRRGAVPVRARDEIRALEARSRGCAGESVALATPRRSYEIELALAGEHQVRNLALAVLAAEALAERGWDRLDAAAIGRGAAACRWPGRLQRVRIPGTRPVLLDAAHNVEGAAALARFLERLGVPFDLLFGVFGDKDAGAMLELLEKRARRIILTSPRDERAWDPEAFAAAQPGRAEVEVKPDPAAALAAAREAREPLLVVAGSLRLVGDVTALLRSA